MVELRWNNTSADRPIASRTQDLLGRADFAKALAQVIATWNGKDSFVVAINGEWGSGKSSLKNMVIEWLKEQKKTPLLIEFNPWQWSGQKKVAAAFFREIGRVIGREDSGKWKKLARLWKVYSEYFGAGKAVAGGVRDFVIFLVLLFGGGNSILTLLEKGWAKKVSPLLSALFVVSLGVLAFFEIVSKKIESVFSARAKAEAKTLTEVRNELRTELHTLDAPLLIVIDDIDRLPPDDVKLVFQLVKANGDLPNVVYLLLYQRDLIEKSLAVSGLSDDFLEKVVQAGFDIPTIAQARVDEILIAGINEILSDKSIDKLADEQRFGNLYLSGARDYFKTLRNVYRYLSTLIVHVAAHRKGSGFEVNPIDLIGIEILRVFEPAIYDALRSSKSLLTQEHAAIRGDQGRKTDAEQLKLLVDRAPADTRERVRQILKELFPACSWALGDNYHMSIDDAWYRSHRVCHPDVFEKYFALTIPKGDVSQAEIEDLVSLSANRDALVARLKSHVERGQLDVVLDRLEAYKETIDITHGVPFVSALFDIGDSIPKESNTLDDVIKGTAATHAKRIIYHFLKTVPDEQERVRILTQSLESTNGLYLPVETLASQERRTSRDVRPDFYLISEAAWGALKDLVLQRIRDHAQDMSLAKQNDLSSILLSWSNWSTSEEVRAWVSRLVETQSGLLKLLTSFVSKGSRSGMTDKVPKLFWGIHLKSIEHYAATETLEQKVKAINRNAVTDRERQALDALSAAIAHRKAGGNEDGFPFPDSD